MKNSHSILIFHFPTLLPNIFLQSLFSLSVAMHFFILTKLIKKVGFMKKMISLLIVSLFSVSLFASDTLIINAAEYGIGKFHRKDNKVHQYETNNVWKDYVLKENVSTTSVSVVKNDETNFTIYFTNLEELMIEMIKLSKKEGKKVGILNLNAHGLPGGMWFPKDAKTRDSIECSSWRTAANGSDDANYNQYYSTISKEDILDFERMSSNATIPGFSCLTGIKEWELVVGRNTEFKSIFNNDAQVHMFSCLVGLGTIGDKFTKGLAKLLFTSGTQQVQTSIKLGLGDWSMPEGMGFWGYENDAQLERDNANYPVNRRDRDMMQKGDIRVAQVSVDGTIKSGLIKNEQFMLGTHDFRDVNFSIVSSRGHTKSLGFPKSVKIPGTNFRTYLK